MEGLILILASLGVCQALILSIHLFTSKKGRALANVFLGLVLLGLSVRIGKSIFNHFLEIAAWQRNLGLSGILLVGPSLWFYSQSLFSQSFCFSRRNYWHYLPVAFFIAFCWAIPNDFSLAAVISYLLVMSHMLAYLVTVEHFRRTQLNQVLSRELKRWFVRLLLGLAFIWLYYIAVLVGFRQFYIGGAVTYTALIYVMSYLMLNKQDVSSARYANSSLDATSSQRLMDNIETLFEHEQLFLDKGISLDGVSQRLNCSGREVSQAINEVSHLNFSEYVKRKRIAYAKHLLSLPEYKQQKIMTVALESGFGNVTSFNTAFKALVDMTPSTYRDTQNQE